MPHAIYLRLQLLPVGLWYRLDINGVCDPPQCFTSSPLQENTVKIRKRGRFSFTLREEGGDDYVIVTGRATKRSVSGTVQAHSFSPANSSRPARTCDTPVLTWTATK